MFAKNHVAIVNSEAILILLTSAFIFLVCLFSLKGYLNVRRIVVRPSPFSPEELQKWVKQLQESLKDQDFHPPNVEGCENDPKALEFNNLAEQPFIIYWTALLKYRSPLYFAFIQARDPSGTVKNVYDTARWWLMNALFDLWNIRWPNTLPDEHLLKQVAVAFNCGNGVDKSDHFWLFWLYWMRTIVYHPELKEHWKIAPTKEEEVKNFRAQNNNNKANKPVVVNKTSSVVVSDSESDVGSVVIECSKDPFPVLEAREDPLDQDCLIIDIVRPSKRAKLV